MRRTYKLLVLSTLTISVLHFTALSAQDKSAPSSSAPVAAAKPAPLPPELNPAEQHQLDRFAALYEELVQQMSDAQARIKVVQEMQQKLMADYTNFQAAAIAARGYKNGEATLDLQARKVTANAAKVEPPVASGR